MTRQGVKPQPQKIEAILALLPPKNVRQLRRFLGMVQFYRDMWEKRSEMLAPLTDLVGECGTTKSTKKKGTKKVPWHWDDVHQEAFDRTKKAIAKDVLLAYPNYSEPFDIHSDASKVALGAIISQNGKPIAFFYRKMNSAQMKYTTTERELLSIIECLREFKGMLWGQRIRVHTDHINLLREGLGRDCDRVHRWRLILEEYGPEFFYIKGEDNSAADAMSRLEFHPDFNSADVENSKSSAAW